MLDNERTMIHDAIPLLRACAANNQINQQLVSLTTVNFERELIQIPVNSRYILGNRLLSPDDDDDDDDKRSKSLTAYEKAIFI